MVSSGVKYRDCEVAACFVELQELREAIDITIQARINSLIGVEAPVCPADTEDAVKLCDVQCDAEYKTLTDSCPSDSRAGTKPVGPKNSGKYRSQARVSEVMPQRPRLSYSYSEADVLRKVSAVQESDSAMRVLESARQSILSQHVFCSFRSVARRAVESPLFDFVFGAVVLLSSIVVGLQVEYARDESLSALFDTITDWFGILFVIELIFRINAKGFSFFKRGPEVTWNYLDFLFVMISAAQYVYKKLTAGESLLYGGKSGLLVLRLARLVRLLKLVRVIRVLRFFRALRILVHSICSTIRSLVWAIMLLTLIIYLFAIVFTQAANEHITAYSPGQPLTQFDKELLKYFGTISRSVLTLFQCITSGMSWEIAASLLSELHTLYLAIFLAYVTFSMLAVLNVITGFFCQSAMEHAESDEEEVIQTQLKSIGEWRAKLEEIFHTIDEFDSGRFTLTQFEKYCANDRVRVYFESLGLDVSDAWRIFSMLDVDESNTICMNEFINGCLQMKGGASRMDIREVVMRNRWMMDQMTSLLQLVRSTVEQQQADASSSSDLLAYLRSCASETMRESKADSVLDSSPLYMSL